MQSNAQREAYVKEKAKRFGDWVIEPKWVSRMNKTTLGLETASGKQGGSVFWFKWAVYYYPQGEGKTMLAEFEKFADAKAFLKARFLKI